MFVKKNIVVNYNQNSIKVWVNQVLLVIWHEITAFKLIHWIIQSAYIWMILVKYQTLIEYGEITLVYASAINLQDYVAKITSRMTFINAFWNRCCKTSPLHINSHKLFYYYKIKIKGIRHVWQLVPMLRDTSLGIIC